MKSSLVKKTEKIFKLDFSKEKDNSIWLTDAYSLRKLVGILGMALPLLLYVFLYISSGYNYPLESISHYYYTRVGSIFVIVISLLAIFLIIYKGQEPIDFFVSLSAGVFALLLLLFPTSNITDICCDPLKSYSVTVLRVNPFRPTFHYISAAIFLLCLSYMSIFLFTKSDMPPAARISKKVIRNRIYRICGFIMLLSIIIISLGLINIIPSDFYFRHHMTFWMEVTAIESFGFSWFVKGRTIFCD